MSGWMGGQAGGVHESSALPGSSTPFTLCCPTHMCLQAPTTQKTRQSAISVRCRGLSKCTNSGSLQGRQVLDPTLISPRCCDHIHHTFQPRSSSTWRLGSKLRSNV